MMYALFFQLLSHYLMGISALEIGWPDFLWLYNFIALPVLNSVQVLSNWCSCLQDVRINIQDTMG